MVLSNSNVRLTLNLGVKKSPFQISGRRVTQIEHNLCLSVAVELPNRYCGDGFVLNNTSHLCVWSAIKIDFGNCFQKNLHCEILHGLTFIKNAPGMDLAGYWSHFTIVSQIYGFITPTYYFILPLKQQNLLKSCHHNYRPTVSTRQPLPKLFLHPKWRSWRRRRLNQRSSWLLSRTSEITQ